MDCEGSDVRQLHRRAVFADAQVADPAADRFLVDLGHRLARFESVGQNRRQGSHLLHDDHGVRGGAWHLPGAHHPPGQGRLRVHRQVGSFLQRHHRRHPHGLDQVTIFVSIFDDHL